MYAVIAGKGLRSGLSIAAFGSVLLISVSSCGISSGSPKNAVQQTARGQSNASSGPAEAIPATGVTPITSTGDPACLLVTPQEVSAAFGVPAQGPFGPSAPGHGDSMMCFYQNISKGHNLTIALYNNLSPAAFAAGDFEPSGPAQWPHAALGIGDQSIAWNLSYATVIAFREGRKTVVIEMTASASPSNASWKPAINLAKIAAARI
jgi:hypothetical protein